jgi:adenosylhomocysteinase
MVRLVKEGKTMEKKVYDVSKEQDQEVAKVKLEAMGIKIDKLTPEQEKYQTAYEAGT